MIDNFLKENIDAFYSEQNDIKDIYKEGIHSLLLQKLKNLERILSYEQLKGLVFKILNKTNELDEIDKATWDDNNKTSIGKLIDTLLESDLKDISANPNKKNELINLANIRLEKVTESKKEDHKKKIELETAKELYQVATGAQSAIRNVGVALPHSWHAVRTFGRVSKITETIVEGLNLFVEPIILMVDIYRARDQSKPFSLREIFSRKQVSQVLTKERTIDMTASMAVSAGIFITSSIAFFGLATAAPVLFTIGGALAVSLSLYNLVRHEIYLASTRKELEEINTKLNTENNELEQIEKEMSELIQSLKYNDEPKAGSLKNLSDLIEKYDQKKRIILNLEKKKYGLKKIIGDRQLNRANLIGGVAIGGIVLLGIALWAFPPIGGAATAGLIIVAAAAGVGLMWGIAMNRYKVFRNKKELKSAEKIIAEYEDEKEFETGEKTPGKELGSQEEDTLYITKHLSKDPVKTLKEGVEHTQELNDIEMEIAKALSNDDHLEMINVAKMIVEKDDPETTALLLKNDEAINYLKEAINLNPNEPSIKMIARNDAIYHSLKTKGLDIREEEEGEGTKIKEEKESQEAKEDDDKPPLKPS